MPNVSEKQFKRWIKSAIAGYAVLAFGVGYAAWAINDARDDQQKEITKNNTVQISAVRAAAVSNCNNNFAAVQNARAVLKTFDKVTTAQFALENLPEKTYRDAHDLYLDLISSLRLPDCRKIAKLVIVAPHTPVDEVAPKYVP